MRLGRTNAYKLWLIIDSIIFAVSAFGATLLTSFFDISLTIYVLILVVATIVFAFVRWLSSDAQRISYLAHDTMADRLADTAASYGMTDLYNMQIASDQNRRNSDTAVTIEKAQNMSLAANSGASYLSVGLQRHWPVVRQRLCQRVPFRVVLLDPLSDERALRNSVNVAGERDDNKLPLGDIIRACNEFPNMDVRFASRGMSCSVFITQDDVYFDPYHLAEDGGRISNRFFCLRMQKIGVPKGISNYEMLSRHFDALWRDSTPLADWLRDNRGMLDALPELSLHKRLV